MTDFPRTLVISPSVFNCDSGSGVTMGNLFRGWPPEAIAQIHSDRNSNPDTSVCTQYLYVPYRPALWLDRRAVKNAYNFIAGRRLALGSRVRFKAVRRWCESFRPEVIYSRPTEDAPHSLWLTEALAKSLDLPYVLHVMDDWPERVARKMGHTGFGRKLLDQLKRLIDGAETNIGISEEMCEAFEKRYERKFVPFHNCVDLSQWPEKKTRITDNETFNILYLGVVTRDKEIESLKDLCDAVVSIGQSGRPVQLSFYSAPVYEPLIRSELVREPWTQYAGYVERERLPEVLGNVDLLVLALNFDPESLAYAGYSFQTKVPEYMASGTPTLVYAPATSPNLRYARKYEWAEVVDQRDPGRLIQSITRLMDDPSLGASYGKRARELVYRHHDSSQVRRDFRNLLLEAAQGRAAL
jgi:glycosyltransferase involved in cell wall biosynthesis